MSAHAQIANIVKKNYAGGAGRIGGLTQQGADHNVRAARLVYHCRAESIVLDAKAIQTLGQRAAAKVGTSAEDYACRLPTRVGVNHANSLGVASGHFFSTRHWHFK